MSPVFRRRAGKLREFGWQVDLWTAAAAIAVPIFFSWTLLGDDFPAGRSAEVLLGAKTLGILPPPGYPLYLLVLRFILGTVSAGAELWRLQAAGVLFAAAMAGVLYFSARRLNYAPAVSWTASAAFSLSPFVWRTSLLPAPQLFHVLLLAIALYGALGLFASERKLSGFGLGLWGLICGLAGGQQPALLAWILPLLALAGMLGLPYRRASLASYLWLAGGVAAGMILPYIYLPVRLFAPTAFVNTQFVPQFAELRQAPSLSLLLAWLGWFFTFGAQGVHQTGVSFADTLGLFVRAFPFLGLALFAFGAFLNLRDLLLERPHGGAAEGETQGRLFAGGLPLLALPLLLLIWPRAQRELELSLSLCIFLWSLAALDFAYLELGNPELSGEKPRPLHPSWAGYGFLLLVPVLYLIQTGPVLQGHVRRAAAPDSTLAQSRAALARLPENSAVIAPDYRLLQPLLYLRRTVNLRPDLLVLSFFDAWPKRGYGGRQSLEVLGGSWEESWRRRENFTAYWNQSLTSELAAGRTVRLLLAPAAEDAALGVFLQTFDVLPTDAWRVWPRREAAAPVLACRVIPSAPPRVGAAAREAAGLGSFGGAVTLLSARLPEQPESADRFALLRFSLTWRTLAPLAPESLRLTFRVTAAPGRGRPRGHVPEWRAERRWLRADPGTRLAPSETAEESYQLLAPAPLAPGAYRLWVRVLETVNGRGLPAGPGRDYFVMVGDFTVLGADAPAAVPVVPAANAQGAVYSGAGSSAVPGK